MSNQPTPKLKVGGTLGLDDLYVRRAEDDIVFQVLAEGNFCNILTSRQMGKSSLMVRLMNRLHMERGARIACVDLAGDLGTPTQSVNGVSVPDADAWYIGFLDRVAGDLGLGCDVDRWWHNDGRGTPNGRLLQFFRTVAAPKPGQPVFVFVDEVDASLKLPYSNDFFTAVRAIYNERSMVTAYRSITFCLIGVASPGELIRERHTTPYNVGETIELRDFDRTLHDLSPLYAAMSVDGAPGEELVHAVLGQTGGQPFLTVALCEHALAQNVRAVSGILPLIDTAMLTKNNDALTGHFETISRFLSERPRHERETLRLYGAILRGQHVHDRVTAIHLDLRLSGLVKRDGEGFLIAKNRIYRRRFGPKWLAQTKPMKRRRKRNSLIVIILAVALTSGAYFLHSGRKLDCATASLDIPDGMALSICEREYEQTRDLHAAVYTADLRRRAGDLNGAAVLANGVLATEVRGDALQILGEIALAERRTEDAFKLIQEARDVHREMRNHAGSARDVLILGRIQIARSRYADALARADECLAGARAVDDEALQGHCHLLAARALTSAGNSAGANQELDLAAQYISKDRDLAQLWYERGIRYQKIRYQNQLAVAAFERSLEFAKRAESVDMMCDTHVNMAYSLADVGRTDEAEAHLAESAIGACYKRLEARRKEIVARIAYRRGNLGPAFVVNEKIYATILDEGEKLDISTMQAMIALRQNELETAMIWAERGVDITETLVATQTRKDLRSWVLDSRRESFEILFVALVRLGRVNDAIAIFDRWLGNALFGEMTRPSFGVSATSSSTVQHASIEVSRQVDLVALVIAMGDVWRITATDGRPRVENLGQLAQLVDRLDGFRSAPSDAALGNDLGAMFLPGDIIRKTEEPLYVFLDIPIFTLPFAALRYAGQPVVASRPVVRIPRLGTAGPSSCEMRVNRGDVAKHALILADAEGDLPDARQEASMAASLLGIKPLVGAAATSVALFAGKPDALLHIAVHSHDKVGLGALMLYDRTVSAQEIAEHKFDTDLVILSGSSTAMGFNTGSSLATAFLASGSRYVIGTLRTMSDAGARELISSFYVKGGIDAPVRALAKVQAAFSTTDNQEWANIAVFGNCVPHW